MVEGMVDTRLELNEDPTEAGTVTVQEVVEEVPYQTPQPSIPFGTRFRVFPKNFRNQLCGCNSGLKFKKCCINEVQSEHLYAVPSANFNVPKK